MKNKKRNTKNSFSNYGNLAVQWHLSKSKAFNKQNEAKVMNGRD